MRDFKVNRKVIYENPPEKKEKELSSMEFFEELLGKKNIPPMN